MPETRVTSDDIRRLHDVLWPPYGEGRRLGNWLTKGALRDLIQDWNAGRVSYADPAPGASDG